MRDLGVPQDQGSIDSLMSVMGRLDIFATLTPEQMRKMLYFIKFVEFDAEEVIFEQGDAGDAFYVVESGQVEAFTAGFLGTRKPIRTMGPGYFFGELALLLKQPRSASVACLQPTRCFVLDRADLELFMERNPDIAASIKSVARERFDNPV